MREKERETREFSEFSRVGVEVSKIFFKKIQTQQDGTSRDDKR